MLADKLVALAELNQVSAVELAARAVVHPDRLNNGGLREVIELLLADGDDPEWIESLCGN